MVLVPPPGLGYPAEISRLLLQDGEERLGALQDLTEERGFKVLQIHQLLPNRTAAYCSTSS